MQKFYLFTDGGARGNPGPAGAGVLIVDEKKQVLDRFASYIGETTNNKAEYMALVLGLIRAKNLGEPKDLHLICHLDSELVAKQLTGVYKIKDQEIQKIAAKAMRRASTFGKVDYKIIVREKNKIADKLVNMAIDSYLELNKN